MSEKYVIVTELEFDNLLKFDKGWTKEYQGNELVYSYITIKKPDVTIKVYSSIVRDNGIGRKKGADAIRIVGVKNGKGILKASRTYRIVGWEEKVKAKVIELIGKIW